MLEKITVPDIGGANDVDVIEVFVKVGDRIEKDMSLITLEGDKATMEIPATVSGKVVEVQVKPGDKVSQGAVILTVETEKTTHDKPETVTSQVAPKETAQEKIATQKKEPQLEVKSGDVHAGPGVRRIAHELEIDLSKVKGSGDKGRILKEDLKKHLGGQSTAGFSLPKAPAVDFSLFGEITTKPLSKIQKISGAHLHRNWVSIPHVTQFAKADITELEKFRQSCVKEKKLDVKLTLVVFVMKALVVALKEFPQFNASLDASGENLILKKYFHIGVAVDTPQGLVVPVIKDVDKKSLTVLAKEITFLSEKARGKGLSIQDMQGGCMSISSLGGIGGTAFTPIINAPEVAILGVSKAMIEAVFQEEKNEFSPRLMLPLSLSYDHRVIDGADAARFIVFLSHMLSDIRSLLL